MFLAALAASLLLTQGALGSELRKDGYGFQPPEGFVMVRPEPFTGTRVGAVSLESGKPRALSVVPSRMERGTRRRSCSSRWWRERSRRARPSGTTSARR
ncbi:hypothetical protein [Stigmatella aurantiaca]|uniref:hypothetical protein n=1 Tax=Stigmatella aurantiaca TaxID=41 RepID=UPI001E47ADF9|nr:hypothetical protein [Stigmatella aurantiaca]